MGIMAKMPDSIQLLDNRFTVLLRGHATGEETVKQLLARIREVDGVVDVTGLWSVPSARSSRSVCGMVTPSAPSRGRLRGPS